MTVDAYDGVNIGEMLPLSAFGSDEIMGFQVT